MVKLNKNQRLFRDLTLYFALELHNQADKPITEMQLEQKKNRDSLLNEIAKILLSYTISDNALSLNLKERQVLNSKLGVIIDNAVKSELKNETSIAKELLSNTCLEKCSTNDYIYSLGNDSKLTEISGEILDQIVNSKIDGEIWSDRLWSNKNELAKDLKIQVRKFLKGDITVNNIEKVIKTKYNANATNVDRLVRTEVARVQSAINDYWGKENGIEQQLFMATLDNLTSEICRSYDGMVFNINDAGKPIPPLHPYCRSCLVNLPNKDWRPSMRIDNETKQNINWTTYKEWEENK